MTAKAALSPKQEAFVREYLVDLNATQAAIRAGYSPKTAREQASRLLSKVNIREAVAKAQQSRAERVEVKADTVLRELLRIATSDVRRLFDEHGRLRPVHTLPDDAAASISSVEVVTTRVPGTDPVEVVYTAKVKQWDKKGALELLGKHLKLFTEKVEVQHTGQVHVYLPSNGR